MKRTVWPWTWSTRNELEFLEGLGHHTNGRFLGQRRPLLLGYRRGLGLRRVWVGLDRATILAAADKAFRETPARSTS